MTAVDKETTVTSVTFLSPNQQVNHTFKAKDEGTSTVQENHKTNVGENLNQGLDNRIRINWQLMIIILALLTVLTSTYFGKCVHRHWISRTFRVSISNTTPTIALGDINQTPTILFKPEITRNPNDIKQLLATLLVKIAIF